MYTVTIALLTYNRFDYAARTIVALAEHLRHDRRYCTLNLWISDDGTPPRPEDGGISGRYIEQLAKRARSSGAFDDVNAHHHPNVGYGGNYNTAMEYARLSADYILPLEDDWQLLRPLDISDLCESLKALGGGCIRLGYLGYTQALRGEFVYARGQHWIRLDPESPERHVFAGHPRLESLRWNANLGRWPERIEQGSTEFEVAGRPQARQDVYWPVDLVKPSGDLFAHIGTIKA